ncbi:MAG: OmpH family outer membrane protein [Gammaproteobacteria bacterium]|nr:OmpH family outer membrane protein [Gammaproteobacteria bacterium]
MNITRKLLLGTALGLFAAGGLLAQETALKIGFVNLRILTVESPQGREAQENISEMFAERQRKLSAKQTELEQKNEIYERDRETMGTEQVRNTERDLIALNREIQQMSQALQEDAQLENQNMQGDLGTIFLSHIRQVGEENDYDLVLNSDVVLHASDAVNLTPQVLGALQETYSSEQQD